MTCSCSFVPLDPEQFPHCGCDIFCQNLKYKFSKCVSITVLWTLWYFYDIIIALVKYKQSMHKFSFFKEQKHHALCMWKQGWKFLWENTLFCELKRPNQKQPNKWGDGVVLYRTVYAEYGLLWMRQFTHLIMDIPTLKTAKQCLKNLRETSHGNLNHPIDIWPINMVKSLKSLSIKSS